MIDAIPMKAEGERSFDMLTATDLELLQVTVSYLERVRAHPQMIQAVGRAALRLLDQREGNGHAARG